VNSVNVRHALLMAESVAENYKAFGGDINSVTEALGGISNEDMVMIFYDNNWQLATEKDATFVLQLVDLSANRTSPPMWSIFRNVVLAVSSIPTWYASSLPHCLAKNSFTHSTMFSWRTGLVKQDANTQIMFADISVIALPLDKGVTAVSTSEELVSLTVSVRSTV